MPPRLITENEKGILLTLQAICGGNLLSQAGKLSSWQHTHIKDCSIFSENSKMVPKRKKKRLAFHNILTEFQIIGEKCLSRLVYMLSIKKKQNQVVVTTSNCVIGNCRNLIHKINILVFKS